jgi:hypothetical protein
MQAIASDKGKRGEGLAVKPWEGLLIGLAAAAIVWGTIQAVHPVFRVPKKFDVPRIGMPTEMFLAHRREQERVDRWNAALYLGGLGLLMSLAIGAREAAARRSAWSPILTAPLGGIGGAVGGVLGCMVLQYVRTNVGQAELINTMEAQLATCVPLGLGVGLGLGLTTWTAIGTVKYGLTGVAGGAVAAVAYSVAIALFMPETNTDALLPEEAGARLLWLTMAAGTVALIIPLAGWRRG